MRLLHYTAEPLEYDPHREYLQRESWGYGKPNGLWVSCEGDDDWPTWSRAEEFGVERLACVVEVTLTQDANICYISSADQLLAFHQEYATLDGPGGTILGKYMDWDRVKAEWDGLIIAPYLWSMRLSREVPWYYGWDCASGSIWNLSVVSTVLPANKVLT
jgi:hypothetical protein